MLNDHQREVLTAVCLGNADAFAFCSALVDWLHWIDDEIDLDVSWHPKDIVAVNMTLILTFAENPFFQKHRESLLTLLQRSFRAWLDANSWASRPGVRDRHAADVLKSTYHEIIWHVADLVGGWDHAREITKSFRAFDYEQ